MNEENLKRVITGVLQFPITSIPIGATTEQSG